MDKKDLCYGCGYAGCSMCCQYNARTREEALELIKKQQEDVQYLKKKYGRRE